MLSGTMALPVSDKAKLLFGKFRIRVATTEHLECGRGLIGVECDRTRLISIVPGTSLRGVAFSPGERERETAQLLQILREGSPARRWRSRTALVLTGYWRG